MTLFRALLVFMFLGLAAYTGLAVMNDGINLISPFLRDIASLGWPGQFSADFLTYLWLSALWIAWRHKFSAAGIAMAESKDGSFDGGYTFDQGALLLEGATSP